MDLSRRQLIAFGAAGLVCTPALASETDAAALHVVHMYGANPDPAKNMAFSPRVLWVKPGATIRFHPHDQGHNSQSTPKMTPAGAKPWRGPFGKDVDVTLQTPGYYGYHCLAHKSMCMVGLIIVQGPDQDSNLQAAKTVQHTGGAAKAWEQIWAEVAKGPPSSPLVPDAQPAPNTAVEGNKLAPNKEHP